MHENCCKTSSESSIVYRKQIFIHSFIVIHSFTFRDALLIRIQKIENESEKWPTTARNVSKSLKSSAFTTNWCRHRIGPTTTRQLSDKCPRKCGRKLVHNLQMAYPFNFKFYSGQPPPPSSSRLRRGATVVRCSAMLPRFNRCLWIPISYLLAVV